MWKTAPLASVAFRASLASAAVLLSGCAAMNQVSSDVSAFSAWPDGRAAGTYAFERLPSQQANAALQQQVEDAARVAIEGAGFTPASSDAAADVKIQLGARVDETVSWPYTSRFWVGGGFHYRHFRGGAFGPGWGWNDWPVYEREVAVVIRDRASGRTLYETHATSDGNTAGITTLLRPMFDAAMRNFPHPTPGAVRVTAEASR